MARELRNKQRFQKRKLRKEATLPFTKTNYLLMALGVVVVALGFVAMAEGSVEGTMPLVVAPILLVIGYCIIIPVGILYRRKTAPPTMVSEAGASQRPMEKSGG